MTRSIGRRGTPRADANPPEPDRSEDGVDLTLIRAFLALTPAQRLQAIEDRQHDLKGIRKHRNTHNGR